MSDIPRARECLYRALAVLKLADSYEHIWAALRLMNRAKPRYRAPAHRKPLTRAQIARAKAMRARHMPYDKIAEHLGTNIGRISEAINGKRKGI